MSDEIWTRDEPASPCVKLCVVHPASRLCMGCLRSIDEIAAWSGLGAAERRAILADLPSREGRTRPARQGGRAARRLSV